MGTTAGMGMRAAVTMLALVACARAPVVRSSWDGKAAPGTGDAPDAAAPSESTHDTELAAAMHARLDELALAGPAVVRGDVARARAVADRMLGETEGGPQRWSPHLAALRVEVRALAHADELADAAAATARVSAQCGACHEALQADVRLADAPMPAHGSDPMLLHAWSVERMREGLIVPSSERWLQGTATFASLPGCQEPEASRMRLCERVKVLAHRAHVAETTDARTRVYGELLATCSECHAKP